MPLLLYSLPSPLKLIALTKPKLMPALMVVVADGFSHLMGLWLMNSFNKMEQEPVVMQLELLLLTTMAPVPSLVNQEKRKKVPPSSLLVFPPSLLLSIWPDHEPPLREPL